MNESNNKAFARVPFVVDSPPEERKMYVYIRSQFPEEKLWTVGFYKPDGKWEPESDHESAEEAAKRVAYLNGGLS